MARTTLQKPIVKIADVQRSQEEFQAEIVRRFTSLEKLFNNFTTFIVGTFAIGFVVLLFTLITIVFQAWEFHATYIRERHQLTIQEELIKNTVKQQQDFSNSQHQLIDSQTELHRKINKLTSPSPPAR